MSTKELETRLTALEKTVAELERRIAANGARTSEDPRTMDPKSQPHWWVDGAGRFKDDPVFEDVVKIMRKNRALDYARAEKRAARSKHARTKAKN